MSLQEEFIQAQADSKNLPERPDNRTLLQLYARFKQGSLGDITGERPGMNDFINRAKFDAWAGMAGTPQESAMQQYVELVSKLKGE